MKAHSPVVFFSAAEVSGDTHAANLIRALRSARPDAACVGVGGPRMAEAGCELIEDCVGDAAMLFDPLRRIPYYRRLIRRVADEVARRKPAVMVPVDSPGLNWHMAAAAKRRGVPVMYYIAPQVWAWAPWRIRKVRRWIDHVACILPFEQDYFRRRGVSATFVGHPLFDHIGPRTQDYPAPPSDGAWRIALLPGSRAGEVRRHAAGVVAAAERIGRRYPKAAFTLCAGDERVAAWLREQVGEPLEMAVGRTSEVMAASHLALAASGTVTLEAAHLGLPMVIFYRTSRLLGILAGSWLIRTSYYALVNILAGRPLVDEFIPWFGDPAPLADAALRALDDPDRLLETSAALATLADTLRPPDARTASDAAAELVLNTMC
ncbi:MAG: lipid-A-disaccharide synthase [Planctomycetota bacterium]